MLLPARLSRPFHRHAAHVRRLILDVEATLEQLQLSLALSDLLPNLKFLELTSPASTLLLGVSLLPGASFDDGLDLNRAAFRRLALRVDDLYLEGFEAAGAARVLDVFPSLVALEMNEDGESLFSDVRSEDLASLVTAIRRHGKLRTLALDRHSGDDAKEDSI